MKQKTVNSLNSILIEGNLVRDAELRDPSEGMRPACNFVIASSRYVERKHGLIKEVSFFNIEAWDNLAESAGRHGKKGRGVKIVGRLKQLRWNDVRGKCHSKISIEAEHIEFRPNAESGDEYPEEMVRACAEESAAAGDSL